MHEANCCNLSCNHCLLLCHAPRRVIGCFRLALARGREPRRRRGSRYRHLTGKCRRPSLLMPGRVAVSWAGKMQRRWRPTEPWLALCRHARRSDTPRTSGRCDRRTLAARRLLRRWGRPKSRTAIANLRRLRSPTQVTKSGVCHFDCASASTFLEHLNQIVSCFGAADRRASRQAVQVSLRPSEQGCLVQAEIRFDGQSRDNAVQVQVSREYRD